MTINLLPNELKQGKVLGKRIGHFNLYLILAIFLVLLLWLMADFYNAYLIEKMTAFDSESESIQGELRRYAEVENKIKNINTKLDKIDKADQTRVLWSNVLTELAKSAPALVSISSLSLESAKNSISLNGEAETRREIAKFKEKLESSSYFENVVFSTSTQNESRNNFSFSLSAVLEKIK